MGKWYRYLLIVLTFRLIRYVREIDARSCVPIAENPLNTIVLRPNESNWHPPFDCWNSQLALDAKVQLSQSFNMFRNDIAENRTCTIYKTVWSWVLEKEAISIALDNPSPRIAVMPMRNICGVDYDMICEESIVKFAINRISPASLAAQFYNLLIDEEDLFGNFDDFGNFRRSSASHFGCSFVLSGKIGTLVCVYCAKAEGSSDNPMDEVVKECPPNMKLDNSTDNNYPYLCIPKLKYYDDLFGCDQLDRIKEVCKEQESEMWRRVNLMVSELFYPITNGRESTYFVLNVLDDLNEKNGKILSCDEFGEKCPPILPKWAYAYNSSTMQLLNKISIRRKGESIGYGQNNAVVKIIQDDTEYNRKATCCLYFFALFIILFIAASVLAYFTYKHSKINTI